MQIVVAQPNESVARGLALVLEEGPDLNVTAVELDAASALRRVKEQKPDLLLLDASLANGDLSNLIKEVAFVSPGTGVALLSLDDHAGDVHAAASSGARAYISASLAPEALRSSVMLAASGQVVAAAPQLESLQDLAAVAGDLRGRLSDREREVVTLVSVGLTNGEIADRLSLTENTVKVHLRNIFKKVDVRNRAALTAWAKDLGLSGFGDEWESAFGGSI